MGKRVLVIGQGGREHALVWKLAQSPSVAKIYAAPGNPGIARLAECVDISVNDIDQLLQLARDREIDLTVVGPEAPLMEGIVDRFNREGLLIFGPTAAAARIEGSKIFTKELLQKYHIPTASFRVCENMDQARAYIRACADKGLSVVVKADGLAAGKGVVVARNQEEALQAVHDMLEAGTFGEAGRKVVVEECLQGEEVSLFVLADGRHHLSLCSAQDHKRIFDNDEGPNTGGMGAYTYPTVYTPELHRQVEDTIIKPVLRAMEAEGYPYQGVLYAGLMITTRGPMVLEFNARFGDPEAQVVLPMIKGDLVPLLEGAARGSLDQLAVEMEPGTCVGVVLASGGYPGGFEKGKVISGLDRLDEDTLVFHAGTREENGSLLTNGGRVLTVVGRGNTIGQALDRVYREVEKIHFDKMHFRRDIGFRALEGENR